MHIYHVRVTSSSDMRLLYENEHFISTPQGVANLAIRAAKPGAELMRDGVTVEFRERGLAAPKAEASVG